MPAIGSLTFWPAVEADRPQRAAGAVVDGAGPANRGTTVSSIAFGGSTMAAARLKGGCTVHTLEEHIGVPLSDELAAQAEKVGRRIEDLLGRVPDDGTVELRADDAPETLLVPVIAVHLLRDILLHLGNGEVVRILPLHAELTTQRAAALLNCSRPFIVKLIENGELPARRVGTHRRVRLEDVLAYQARDDEQRRDVLDDLAREAEDLGRE